MIKLTVNGSEVQYDGDPSMPLLWFLRDVQGLTGTKFGCGIAQCGACTVHVNGEPRRSCVAPIGTLEGADVTTIEGATGKEVEAVRAAWVAHDVPQCGYCQSGQIMSAVGLLSMIPKPTRQRHRPRHDRQRLPLLHLPSHQGRHPRCGRTDGGLSMNIPVSTNRRQFLKGSAAVGLVVGFHIPLAKRALGAEGSATEFVPNAFIRIAPDNTVTVICKHIEFGQGPYTGIATILADELDADWAQMRLNRRRPTPASTTTSPSVPCRAPAARPPWPTRGTSCAPPAPRPARASSRRRPRSGASMRASSPSRRVSSKTRPARPQRSASSPASRSRSSCRARSSRRIRAPGS